MYPIVSTFDSGQRAAWSSFLSGTNVAVMGPAGCGKSRVLEVCIAAARRLHGDSAVLVMSWTWAAAQQIGGRSYHSFLGIGPGDASKEKTLEDVRRKGRIRTTLELARVIVVDEAPTFPARHFTQLEFVLRALSEDCMQGEPWGGRQVLCTFSGPRTCRLLLACLVFWPTLPSVVTSRSDTMSLMACRSVMFFARSGCHVF